VSRAETHTTGGERRRVVVLGPDLIDDAAIHDAAEGSVDLIAVFHDISVLSGKGLRSSKAVEARLVMTSFVEDSAVGGVHCHDGSIGSAAGIYRLDLHQDV